MMRRDPAGHEIETGIGERQRLGPCADKGNVAQIAPGGKPARHGEHLRCRVAGHHMGDMAGQRERHMTGAGGDVEGGPAGPRRRKFHEPAQAVALGMGEARRIALRERAEPLLRQRFRFVFQGGVPCPISA